MKQCQGQLLTADTMKTIMFIFEMNFKFQKRNLSIENPTYLSILTNPSARAGYDTRSIF